MSMLSLLSYIITILSHYHHCRIIFIATVMLSLLSCIITCIILSLVILFSLLSSYHHYYITISLCHYYYCHYLLENATIENELWESFARNDYDLSNYRLGPAAATYLEDYQSQAYDHNYVIAKAAISCKPKPGNSQ